MKIEIDGGKKMSTKEAIEVVMKEYEDKRKELREYARTHKGTYTYNNKVYSYNPCGTEMHLLSNKIANLREFSKLFEN